MRYRRFRDCAGRVHVVERSEEEIRAGWQYAAGFLGTCLLWGAVMTVVSGILG